MLRYLFQTAFDDRMGMTIVYRYMVDNSLNFCSWGYFSKKDGETHSFDLCEECYDKWIGGFQIPVGIQE